MGRFCVFTICAKNYLAQALTLRESTLFYNKIDFYIFLSDSVDGVKVKDGIRELKDSWIPNWKMMAFKYNVIEFSTAIKPFCFEELFLEGYDKVMYLDPDIYVTDSLSSIFGILDYSSIILTPHYCDEVEVYRGAVSENVFLQAGIFNLGFIAVKNDLTGNKMIKWWKNRLENQCYSDKSTALFVDQKWMDFIPAFFPKETVISQNMGWNVAIWNLHERALLVNENKYYIRRSSDGYIFPLVFFHFSGFDPYNLNVINRRHPQYNISTYPSFAPIIKEYSEKVYHNAYEYYSKLKYAYNYYSNGEMILPIHRRMMRVSLSEGQFWNDPFLETSDFYKVIKKSHLISKKNVDYDGTRTIRDTKKENKMEKYFIFPFLKFVLRIIGPLKYSILIKVAKTIGVIEYHKFLLKKK